MTHAPVEAERNTSNVMGGLVNLGSAYSSDKCAQA